VFKDGGGCYAETGRQGMFVTRRLNETGVMLDASALDVALAEADAIDAITPNPGWPMRLHTVGDCPSDETARVIAGAAARYRKRGGGVVWTYTHSWRDVARRSWGDVNVLASCETVEDVQAARARGYQTAIVVDEFERDSRYAHGKWPNVVDVIPCPSMTRGVSCSDCRLCMSKQIGGTWRATIAFEVHGIPATQRAARIALARPDDPDRRTPSVERIRAIRARYLRDEGREPTSHEVAAEIPDLNSTSIWEWLRYLRGEIPHPKERRRRARAQARA
jgi:hypothetical protein